MGGEVIDDAYEVGVAWSAASTVFHFRNGERSRQRHTLSTTHFLSTGRGHLFGSHAGNTCGVANGERDSERSLIRVPCSRAASLHL